MADQPIPITDTCTDPKFSEVFETYIRGGNVKVTFKDGTEVEIDYYSSDEHMHDYLSADDPKDIACAALEAKFDNHLKECAFCRAKCPFLPITNQPVTIN